MASDGPSDLQYTVIKTQTAGLGLRVKSGWAAVVLLTDTAHSPQLSDVSRIELCDPRLRETRQPYHAAMGKLETNSTKLDQREPVVRSISQQALTILLKGYQQKGFQIRRAALVVGSQIDPTIIANPHIRAHALEGQLFRLVLEQALNAHGIRTTILLERDAYDKATSRLRKSNVDLRSTIQNFSQLIDGPWRAEHKLAALAAWFALYQDANI